MVVVSTDEHGRVLDNPPDGRYLDGPAMHALDINAIWKTRITQRLPRLIIPSTAFDAMLVGCCAVRCSSYVLARRLDPDVLAVIESFASSAVISSGAAAALQEATEEFATRLFRDVFFVAHQRLSLCVHAGDVDAAIDLTGAYRLTDIDAIKQRLGVSQTEDLIDFQRVSARSPSIVANINFRAMKLSKPDATLNFDDDAAQLLSWFLKRRLVQTFALARRVPYSVLCPHTGNGGMLTLNTFQLCRRLNHEIF